MSLSDSRLPAVLRRLAGLALVGVMCLTSCRSVPEGGDLGGGNVDAELRLLIDAWIDRAERDPVSLDDDDVRPEDVRRGLERLAERAPRHLGVLVAAGVCALEDGDPEAASQWLDQALNIDPSHVGAACVRAELSCREGNTDRARRILETARMLRPGSAELAEALAGVHFLDGHYDEAYVLLEQAERLGADDADLHWHRGLVSEAEQRSEAARAAFQEALDRDPEDEQIAERLRAIEATGELSEL